MAAQILDILWRVATWGIVGLGGLVVLHALLGDWLAGRRHARKVRRAGDGSLAPRRRCPGGWGRVLWVIPVRVGCWYDMSAATADDDGRFRCPECGRRSGVRRLAVSQRRWRLAGVGLLVAALGLGGRYAREIYRDGWKAVPDEVLVLVPFDERVWLETGTTGSHWLIEAAAKEIAARDVDGRLSPWTSHWLGQRVLRRYQRDPDYGVPEATLETLARLEQTPFPHGIDSKPFIEAVRTIAEVAGVPIEIDEEALRAASIEPERRLMIPAFGTMSCEQALDWACDRARAVRGWGGAAWTIEDGRIVVTTEALTNWRERTWVLIQRPARWLGRVVPGLSSNGSLTRMNTDFLGEAAVLQKSSLQIARCIRWEQRVDAAAGYGRERSAGFAKIDDALRRPLDVPFGLGDGLDDVLHRLRMERGLEIVLDPWGMSPLDSIGAGLRDEVRAELERYGSPDWLDPQTREWIQEATSSPIHALRILFDAPTEETAHDGSRLVLALRARSLLSDYVVYRLPQRCPPREVRESTSEGMTDTALRRLDWNNRVEQLSGRIGREAVLVSSLSRNFVAFDDRVVIIGPPNELAQAAPIVEEFIARWKAELDAQRP